MLAIAVVDGETGQTLFERAAETSVIPASVKKAISTATALHYLGPGHRFRTTLEAHGPIAGGRLAGDLVIRGGGDPTLGSARVPGSLSYEQVLAEWVDAVERAGICEIQGDVAGDDSFFPYSPWPDEWSWIDVANAYGSGTSGLCFNDNQYDVYVEPGSEAGSPARISHCHPPMPHAEWSANVTTAGGGTGDDSVIYTLPDRPERFMKGSVPVGALCPVRGALQNPAAFAAGLLMRALVDRGIMVRGASRGTQGKALACKNAQLLGVIESPPLSAVIHQLNKESFNMYAEMMLMHTARAAGNGSRESGVAAEEAYLKQLGAPLHGVYIHDGSGLSRMNYVTAKALARFMFAMQKEPHFGVWLDSLPVLGVDADLKDRHAGTPLRGRVRAKTGLITRVRALSGYLDARSGRRYCFALFANQYSNSWVEVDHDLDRILEGLYDSL